MFVVGAIVLLSFVVIVTRVIASMVETSSKQVGRAAKSLELKSLSLFRKSKSQRSRARALFDFEMDDDRTLPFRKDDILTLVSPPNEGWVEAELDGASGLVPCNHIEVMKLSYFFLYEYWYSSVLHVSFIRCGFRIPDSGRG